MKILKGVLLGSDKAKENMRKKLKKIKEKLEESLKEIYGKR